MTAQAYIVASKRSPIAPRNGALSNLELHQLSAPVIESLIRSSKIDKTQIDELIVGNALGAGGNPARVIALASGLNENVAGLSIDRQCCSGLDAVLIANDMVISGRASVVIAGGAESYSTRPQRSRRNTETGQWHAYEQPAFTPWPDKDPDMAQAADTLAQQLDISVDVQNEWAIHSHQKALNALARLKSEIVCVGSVEQDTYARNLSHTVCQRAPRIHGSITAANTAVAADGAAFSIIVNEAIAASLGGPQLRIQSGCTIGADPQLPGLAPVQAIQAVLANQKMVSSELRYVEMMEAYAAQAIACIQQLKLDPAICNVGGGGLARGHPIGASGAVLITRLFSELTAATLTEKRRPNFGLAAIAAAGGLGSAVLVEAVG